MPHHSDWPLFLEFYPMVLLSQTQIPGQTALNAKFQSAFGGRGVKPFVNMKITYGAEGMT